MQIDSLNKNLLVDRLKHLVHTERKLTAEIIDYIKEVGRRKLYLELGFTSLFAFLTEELGYSPAAAQRRIDTARIMQELPQIKDEIKTGSLNLTQVSLVAQSVRQKQKVEPSAQVSVTEKLELLNSIKNKDIKSSELIVSQSLDLEIKQHEKQKIQQDESVRLELTLTKEQMQNLNRVKELLSHSHPNLSMAELIGVLSTEFIQRKSPARTVKTEVSDTVTEVISNAQAPSNSRYVPSSVKRIVFRRDQCCQYHLPNGKICGSRFQLQLDHRQAHWAGGSSTVENLQLLCSSHNRLKYKLESCVRISNQK